MTDEGRQPILVILGVVGVLVLAVLGYVYLGGGESEERVEQTIEVPPPKRPEPSPGVVLPVPSTDGEASFESVPELPEEPAFVLPSLGASDGLVREGIRTLAASPDVRRWLGADELVRKFVVLIDNLSNGGVPRRHVEFLAPEGPFAIQSLDDETFELDVRGYDRYNLFVDVLTSFDDQRSVEFYVLLRPLFQEAYTELGYGNQSFDDALFGAMDHLQDAPLITYPIRLKRPVVMYKFEDPRLEAMSEAHKQLVRMGPRNTRLVQMKLASLAAALREVLGR